MILFVALLCLVAAAPASAHDMPFSYLDLHVEDARLTGTVSAHVMDLAVAIGYAHPDSLLYPRVAEREAAALQAALQERLVIEADGARVVPIWGGSVRRIEERQLLSLSWTAELSRRPEKLVVRGPLFTQESQHESFVYVYDRGTLLHQDVLASDAREVATTLARPQSLRAVLATFVYEGIHHIFIGPDHILFVIGLLLLGGKLTRLLKIVTAFTVAHSVTLVLATLQLLRPPSSVIEPVIALSIVVVGVENLLAPRLRRDARAWIAFGFGFVHGFGFASVLRDFGLPREALGTSLFAFNVGVEIGQAAIVLAVTPVLALLRSRQPRYAGTVIAAGSVCVIAAGGYWFVARVLAG
jgi:hydrogenase/urease accessory protein HupE